MIETFFVISPEAYSEIALITRKNILALVKQGFTREELYFMPISEYHDYIKIMNEQYEQEQAEINKSSSDISEKVQNLKMAGNTLPNF